jgi:hypothetical protein
MLSSKAVYPSIIILGSPITDVLKQEINWINPTSKSISAMLPLSSCIKFDNISIT